MSSNWDFRSVLDIHPESDSFSCVHLKPDNSGRCLNRRPLLSEKDLAEAADILDVMDNCESLKTSFEYLEALAGTTLCIIHSEATEEMIQRISGQWRERIIVHMKMEIDTPAARPQSRRSVGRRRTSSSAAVMAVLKEEKEESPVAAKRAADMWKSAVHQVARQNSYASVSSRPTKAMSRKISSLISEVGFQDSTNEEFLASMEAPPPPTRAPPAPPARRMPVRSKTHYPPPKSTDEWSSYPLLSLLTRSSTLLKSDGQIEDESAEIISARVLASRARTNTASSTGSSTSGKASSTESEAGSSAPTSRSSSPTPATNDVKETKPFPPLEIPPMIAEGPLSASPKEEALPTFDFGIYQSLPLPPGHKQSISNGNTPVSVKKLWVENGATVTVPPRTFEFDASRPSFALKTLEKPSSEENTLTSETKMGNIPIANDAKEEETSDQVKEVQAFEESPVIGIELHRCPARIVEEPNLQLPETDRMSMISTSWLNTPRLGLSRSSSVKSSRTPSRSSSLSRTSSLSRSTSTSMSNGKLSRTSSFSLSRTLSRTLSRRSSQKDSPKTNEDEEPSSVGTPPPKPTLLRRATSISRRTSLSKKEESIPLNRLIQRSHELARRLDGNEPHGYAEVAAPITYKYVLPSRPRPISISREPELRFSKLFMGLNTDMNSFPYVSASFPFNIPRKPVLDSEKGIVDRRSKSVGNEERPRSTAVYVRPQPPPVPQRKPAPNSLLQVPPKSPARRTNKPQRPAVPPVPQLRITPAPGRELTPREILTGPPPPVSDVEVCANCGNVQTIWGRCDCGTPGGARGKVGSATFSQIKGNKVMEGRVGVPRPIYGAPVPMERRLSRKVPKRKSTMRRIRKRVARAFTIS